VRRRVCVYDATVAEDAARARFGVGLSAVGSRPAAMDRPGIFRAERIHGFSKVEDESLSHCVHSGQLWFQSLFGQRTMGRYDAMGSSCFSPDPGFNKADFNTDPVTKETGTDAGKSKTGAKSD